MGEAVALLALALCATIAIELPLAALLFGVRGRRGLLVVALAQVVTNPVVELTSMAVGWSPRLFLDDPAWAIVLVFECAATVVEALLFRRASVTRHPWLMSMALNAASFSIGLLASLVSA